MNDMTPIKTTTPKDWETDQEVRWCPGCGDYAILKAVQRTMPEIGGTPENTVFISGIGCSSRFPYYMETYGFHTGTIIARLCFSGLERAGLASTIMLRLMPSAWVASTSI